MKTRTIALNAMMTVLIVIFTFIPLQIGPVKLAVLMLLPVIITAQIEGLWTSIYLGLITGVMSLIVAWSMPSSPVSLMFQNPLISVIPRIMIGVVVFVVSRIMKMIFRNKQQSRVAQYITSFVSSIFGAISNTGFVILMMFIVGFNKTFSYNNKSILLDGKFLASLLSINFLIELAFVAIVVPPIVFAVKHSINSRTITVVKDDSNI